MNERRSNFKLLTFKPLPIVVPQLTNLPPQLHIHMKIARAERGHISHVCLTNLY